VVLRWAHCRTLDLALRVMPLTVRHLVGLEERGGTTTTPKGIYMARVNINHAALRQVVTEAQRRGAEAQVAEIKRLTEPLRCPEHGAGPVFLGPWPSIKFEDCCCPALEQQIRSALSGQTWLKMSQAVADTIIRIELLAKD
jgi:hypothetical protein